MPKTGKKVSHIGEKKSACRVLIRNSDKKRPLETQT